MKKPPQPLRPTHKRLLSPFFLDRGHCSAVSHTTTENIPSVRYGHMKISSKHHKVKKEQEKNFPIVLGCSKCVSPLMSSLLFVITFYCFPTFFSCSVWKALALDPQDGHSWLLLGRTRERMRDIDSAMDVYRRVRVRPMVVPIALLLICRGGYCLLLLPSLL